VTFAAGLATQGCIPIAAVYSTFLQRAFDQIIHDVALQHLHVVFALDRAGLVGADGPTHHGAFDLTYLRTVPGMVIMAPKDESELRDMLYTATQLGDGPVAIRYPRGSGVGVALKEGFDAIPLGKSERLRSGKDIALLAVGDMVMPAMKAADLLGARGVSAEVVNMRFVKPLDTTLLDDIAGRFAEVVTIENNSVVGGFGAGVSEYLASRRASGAHVTIHGIPDQFIDHGTPNELLAELKLDAQGIAAVAAEALGKD
jgi:1-deoxy-D-xylulose-5-phosphate synthase